MGTNVNDAIMNGYHEKPHKVNLLSAQNVKAHIGTNLEKIL
jgi:hypothetical protein